ncbi:hypothetical protein BGZ65_002280 [Modicella reniformis]|uniref:Uncharacterized protein n=1 Tax=Modicella reniformis TaxID=1440133 RepID=A0A9P6LSV4_9FUNG|nr:hypothetical protein BGZ65_002280 [Modicella reniformis]
MPRNSIKLTCFPNSSSSKTSTPTTTTLDSTEAMAMQLNQSSKLVIEIQQPRSLQSYSSANNLRELSRASSDNNDVAGSGSATGQGRDYTKSMMHRSISHPNLQLSRASSSVLGFRKSPPPERQSNGREDFEGPSAKKRKADPDAVSIIGGSDGSSSPSNHHGSVTAQEVSSSNVSASSAVQVFGMDYLAKTDEAAANGLSTAHKGLTSSPSLEALRVAKGSSYALLEDQKEMGIDYSMFTRVETAGWRILIPPNVVASFRSDDFGLMLKPKGLVHEDAVIQEGEETTPVEEGKGAIGRQHHHLSEVEKVEGGDDGDDEEEEEDVNVEGVSRIALRDDVREEQVAPATLTAAGSRRRGQEMHENRNNSMTNPVVNATNAGDIEQDELLEDD